MAKWFYYNESGDKIEVTGGQLKGLAKAGMITPETIVETEEGKKARAGKVQGLTFVNATPSESVPSDMSGIYGLSSPSLPPPAESQPVPPESAPPAPVNPFDVFNAAMNNPTLPTPSTPPSAKPATMKQVATDFFAHVRKDATSFQHNIIGKFLPMRENNANAAANEQDQPQGENPDTKWTRQDTNWAIATCIVVGIAMLICWSLASTMEGTYKWQIKLEEDKIEQARSSMSSWQGKPYSDSIIKRHEGEISEARKKIDEMSKRQTKERAKNRITGIFVFLGVTAFMLFIWSVARYTFQCPSCRRAWGRVVTKVNQLGDAWTEDRTENVTVGETRNSRGEVIATQTQQRQYRVMVAMCQKDFECKFCGHAWQGKPYRKTVRIS